MLPGSAIAPSVRADAASTPVATTSSTNNALPSVNSNVRSTRS
jgi:hypothetical protein